MSEKRLIDANKLLEHAIPVYGAYDDGGSFDAVGVGYIKGAPTVKPEVWISVKDRMPETEQEVLIVAISKSGYKTITTDIYEDGTMPEDDSLWWWGEVNMNYDEENDTYLIPAGWWEYKHYNQEDAYNNEIDDEVTHWMPLPQPPKED